MLCAMVITLFAFVAGVLTLQYQPELPASIGFYAVAGFVFLILRVKVLTAFLIGLCWSAMSSHGILDNRLADALEGKDIIVEGIVTSLPQRFDTSVRFDFEPVETGSIASEKFPAKIRLSWYYPSDFVEAGQRWRFTVRLKKPHGMLNPGGFDYERWLFLQRIGATGYVRSPTTAKRVERNISTFGLQGIRQSLDLTLSEALPDSDLLGLVKSLSIGSRNEITPPQWSVLRRTGTAHLVAISGLHIGLVAGLTYILFRALWSLALFERFSPSQFGAIAAMFIAAFYAALAGFSIPTQRAVIMVTVAMIAIVIRRHFNPLRILCIAFATVLIYDPQAPLSPGFWLSFCAVALIVFVAAARLKRPGFALGAIRVHWVTALGLAPLLLIFFQRTSLIAPIANLIAVPVVSLIVVPLVLIGVLFLLAIPVLGIAVLGCAEKVLGWLWVYLEWLSELPFSEWLSARPGLWAAGLAMVAVMLMFSPRGVPGRWLSLVLVLPTIFVKVPRPDVGEVWLTLLDVGQGLSAVVRAADKTLVYDVGARYNERFDMGSAVVAPFLRAAGINKIDTLVVSHGDNDHIGGARSLASEFGIERVYTSVPESLQWRDSIRCRAGQFWKWDSVEFRFLSPPDGASLSENDMSCVLQIVAAGGRILLPGDIEGRSENWLVDQYGMQLASDVLIVPHHGSNTSSTPRFLGKVKPKIALFAAGYRNRFGFPKADVVDRLKRVNADILTTATAGAITVKIEAKSGAAKPESFRFTRGGYWNR